MRSAKEWLAHYRDDDGSINFSDAEAEDFARAIQVDALESAARICRSHPEDIEWDGYGEFFEKEIRELASTARVAGNDGDGR